MIKKKRSSRLPFFKSKRLQKTFFIFLIIISSASSSFIYNNLLNIFQSNEIRGDHLIKTSSAPVISVNSPANYTLYGKIAPNFSITITGGPGNYSWYEFLETGENSTLFELSGLLNEDVNETFDQNLWDNLSNGTVTIRFYANDSSNAIGYIDAIIRLDIIAPGTPNSLAATPSLWTNLNSFNITWSNPSEPSGIVGAYYKLDEAPMADDDGTYVAGMDIESILNVSVSTEGKHDIYVWLVDTVGNVDYNTYASTELKLDSEDPIKPTSLVATPSSWTNLDSFNITWSNPSDTSGIVGAYYKLDATPITDDDGAYVAGSDIESLIDIQVSAEGMHDIYVWLVDDAGNINYSAYESAQLYLDSNNPNTPSMLEATPSSWTSLDSFNITWINPSDTSGIVGAYYKLDATPIADDDGTYIAGSDIESILGIQVSTEGMHDIYVWLIDDANNINYSAYESTQLYLDSFAPTAPSMLEATPSSWTNLDSFNITWSNPSDTSGIVGAYYKLDAAPIADDDGTYVAGSDIESLIDIQVSTEGIHDIYVWLVDDVNNINYSAYESTQLYLDSFAPTAPSMLEAIPSSWTNLDSFNITWINPSDTSGIVGAYYKLDATPIADDDGTYVAGSDIESILDIQVSTEGMHDIYVWLVDNVNNVNYSAYESTQLFLDTTDPSKVSSLVANPVSWTNIDSFNVTWSNPSDTSGVIGAYYKLDAAPIADDDGTYVAGTDIESLIDIQVSTEGMHDIYVWLVDDANNINYSAYESTQLYLDTIQPIIIDSQPGDDGLRDSGGTTYNIDFSDNTPSSNLDYAQYRITTEAAQGGVVLKDWTNIFTYLGTTDYTMDWSIDFSVCQEGINFVSVRVYDMVGNIALLNDAFYVKKDTIDPTVIVNSPLNNTYWNTPPPINITVFEPNAGSSTYTIPGTPLLPNWLDNNTEELLDGDTWDILPQGQFQIVITSFDSLGHETTVVLTLYKDTNAPILSINTPTNNTYWNLRPSFNLTAFDPNFDSIWYSVNNINITMSNNTLEQLNLSIWNSLPGEGDFQVQFYANDTFGHINDTFILTLYKDITTPDLIINSPYNDTYWKFPPTIRVTVTDSYLHTLWYQVGTTNVVLANNTDQPLDTSIWDLLPEEDGFEIQFYANDSSGNLNDIYILKLYKDVRNPSISIDSPKTNGLYGDIAPNFYISIIEDNLNQTWYTLDNGTTNYIFSGLSGLINQTEWDNFGNGNVTIGFYANDTLGNLGFKEVTVRKNIDAPIITIISPDENDLFGVEAPNFTIYKSGLVLNTTWYTLDGGLTNYTFYGLNGTINQTAWDLFDFENVILIFYINDSLGKIGFDEVTIRKDPDPPEITIDFISPDKNDEYCSEAPEFRVYVNEPNLQRIWYRVGITEILILSNTDITLNGSIWDVLPQGKFIIEIFAEDKLGYINDPLNLTFYKDTLAPLLIVNAPYDQTYYNSPPAINITVFDPNFNSLTYTVVGHLPGNNWLENNTAELINIDIWDDLPQGEFLVSITAYDEFGHLNDTYILTLYKDTLAPVLEIILPEGYSSYNSPPLFKITSDDPNLQSMWYKVDGSISIDFFNNTEQILDSSIWDSITEGDFTIEFYANDSFGYTCLAVNITLNKDITIPTITIISPNNNTYYSASPSMNILASDVNLDSIWYSVMGTKIILLSGPEPLDTNIWDNLPQGEFQVLIFANDSAGNLNNSYTLTLYKDTLAPLITVNSPYNNTYWNSRPILNITAIDPNLLSLSYKVLEYSLVLPNNIDVLLNSFVWSQVSEGTFIIEIIAEDSLGNINNSVKITLVKDTYAPEINISLPQPNELFGAIAPNFEISMIEPYLNSTWYTLIGESQSFVFNSSTGTINQTEWDKFGNGTVTIRFMANDLAGNLGYKDITVRKNIFAPIITISSPGHDDIFGINSPDFVIYKSGSEIQETWYTLDNGLTNYTFSGLSGFINQTAWDNFGYESVTIKFYLNDSIGKIGYDEVLVNKDPNPPTIIVNSPLNQTYYASAPFINITIIEPNLHRVWYVVNSIIIDITDNFTQNFDSFIWNNLSQGLFIVKLYANDTLGNLNNLFELSLLKDTIGPNITILLPHENQKVDRNNPFFELILFDINDIDLSWYTIEGSPPIPFTGTIGRIDKDLWENIWDNLTRGASMTIRFYSSDKLGNINYKDITVIKYQPVGDIISNPIGFISSTVGVMAMIPITVKLTRSRYYEKLNKKEKSKLKKVLVAAFLTLSVTAIFFAF
ncbi:MAG: hypothetical protein KGD58_13950 [Candidatus Lokiarchaeota archaeon]|nr:hypothetical protein [Candidatus Lokiarchaeota archaeon]